MTHEDGHEIPPKALSLLWRDYPDAAVIEPFTYGDVRDERLHRAGIGIADIILTNSGRFLAPYIVRLTRTVDILSSISFEEGIGLSPPGTQHEAVDAIISGEFENRYGL